MLAKTCDACAFCEEVTGECRRFPPPFPMTHQGDWCGEWRPDGAHVTWEDVRASCGSRVYNSLRSAGFDTPQEAHEVGPVERLKVRAYGEGCEFLWQRLWSSEGDSDA